MQRHSMIGSGNVAKRAMKGLRKLVQELIMHGHKALLFLFFFF